MYVLSFTIHLAVDVSNDNRFGSADIEGARVDNLEYLAEHNIDRNLVSKELSRVSR